MKNKKYLTKQNRLELFKMIRLGYSIRQIAKDIEKCHSTVSRELKRCGFELNRNSDYIEHASRAQQMAEERISAGRRRTKLKARFIQHYVELHLSEAGWSPEIIAGRLTRLGYKISAEAIYLWINSERRDDLKSTLKIAGKSMRRKRARRRIKLVQAAAPKKSITERPKEANERISIGHFELDAILSSRGSKFALLVLVDRKSRRVFIRKVSSLEASVYAEKLTRVVNKDISLIKSITSDNGSEHAEFNEIESALNIDWYFCHAYCASERGTVENRNKIIRQFFPKGTRFDEIPDEYIEWVEGQLNHTPMKILGFYTPYEAWKREEALLAA